MGDRQNTTLSAGDPVLYWSDPDQAEDPVPATVIRDLGNDRYTIQLDQQRPGRMSSWQVTRIRKEAEEALSDSESGVLDLQEPFEVDGSSLQFVGGSNGDADD